MAYKLHYSDYPGTDTGPPDPAAWIGPPGPVGPPGPQGIPGPRTTDVANVLDYGADPTGAADSTSAFNTAASQAAPNGMRRSVYVPAGTYKIRNQITLSGSQTFAGAGRGNTFLVIDQAFSATASSVILCGAPSADYGVTIRDLTILFVQPSDVTSRATFKTLAAGGTSGTGGTGVQYPWAIYAPNGSGRVKVQNVQVRGAWNGFLFDTVFWIDNIEMGAAGTGLGQAINNAVLDWNFIGTYEHWPYGWNTPGQNNIFLDGQTIAIQCGSSGNLWQTGIMGQSIANFGGRMLFYGAGWSTITNLNNDSDTCSLEVYGHLWLEITNFYYTAGTNAIRPAIAGLGVGGSSVRVFIHNMYSHSSSSYPLVSVSGNSELHILGAFTIYYTLGIAAYSLASGLLRIQSGRLIGGAGVRTAPLVDQANGSLIVGDTAAFTIDSGNVAVRFQTDNGGNYLGDVFLSPGNTVTFPATVTAGIYGSLGLRASTSYASDAAAASGGVGLGRFYRNGSAVQVRVA